ncbi:MAG: rod shape-determining protein RodA, partial [Syntrophales bacterium]|nr:rod shape-determining protein RodA [Syntrophales bacterium]
MKFDRQWLINFDWPLLGIVLAICFMGVINIYSTGFSLTTAKVPLYLKQIQWIIMGLLFMLIILSIDHRILVQYAYIIHGVAIMMLIFVTFYGYTTHGSQRWLVLGGFSFQPSELVKLTLILSLARYFSDHGTQSRYSIKNLLTPFFIVLVPFLFVVRQPDLGTALMLLIIFISMILFVGIRIKDLLIAVSSGLLLAPLAWYFFKDYQKERVLTFFDPERDPLGSGYHIIQSMIAIGSGGFLGKGFLKGTQTQLKFLPEQQTDFVFSVFAEEWGFIGGVVLMILFLSLILWGLKIAQYSRDLSGTLIAYGITIMIFWGVFINIG